MAFLSAGIQGHTKVLRMTAKSAGKERSAQRIGDRRSAVTRQSILEHTVGVLLKSGHQGLTLRAVAGSAGISLGNLTYHFANKQQLIEALIEHLLTEYVSSLTRILQASETRSAGDVRRLVEWHIRDSVSRETSTLFREIWVLVLHYPAVARALSAAYGEWIQHLRKYFEECCPGCPEPKIEKAVVIMATITEGAAVLFGPPSRPPMALERFVKCAADVICDCLGQGSEANAERSGNPRGA